MLYSNSWHSWRIRQKHEPHMNFDKGWHLLAKLPSSCSMRFLSDVKLSRNSAKTQKHHKINVDFETNWNWNSQMQPKSKEASQLGKTLQPKQHNASTRVKSRQPDHSHTAVNSLQFTIDTVFLHQRINEELCKAIKSAVEILLLYVKVKHSLRRQTHVHTCTTDGLII